MNNKILKHISPGGIQASVACLLFVVSFFHSYVVRAQWTRTDNGISGANVSALVASGTNLFTGTSGGGVFISSDGGSNWSAVNTGLGNLIINVLAVNGTTLFAGTTGGAGLYVSTNNGSNWTASNSGISNNVRCLAVSGSTFFAGTPSGVYVSSDNGTSWTAATTGLSNLNVYTLAVMGSTIFAGTYGGGVFVSSNNGASWTAVNTGLSSLYIYTLAVMGSNIFAGTTSGVYLSSDNGANWTPVNNGLTSTSVHSLTVKGTDILAGTTAGVFLSSNNGANWSAVNTGLTNLDVNSFLVNGTTIFVGTEGGLFSSSNNGTTWMPSKNGLKSITVTCNLVSGANHFAGTREGLYLSTDNEANWTAVNTGLTELRITALTKSGTTIFAGTDGSTSAGGVFTSTNNGTTWTAANTGLTNYSITSLTTSGSNIVAGTRIGVFTSANNGGSWAASSGMPTLTTVNCLLTVGTTLFAGTDSKVYKSTDNGVSWTQSYTGITNSYVRAMVSIGSTIFASTDGDLFVSIDNGANWTVSPHTGMPNGRTIMDFASDGTTLFAGTDYGGVYMSKDNGANWSAVNIPGFPGISVFAYVYDLELNGTTLFAGLENYGLWSRALTEFAPTITSFTPTVGPVGTTVTITGTGFPLTINTWGSVKFNGVNATITSSTTTSITTTVPAGATTGPITVNNGSVSVTSSSNFIVAFPPTITSFTPTTGSAGTEVTITGTNFSTTPADNAVSFNGTPTTVTAATATSLTVTVPAGATTGKISVTVNTLTGTSASDFVVPDSSNPLVTNTSSDAVDEGSNLTITATLVDAESGVAAANLLYRSVADGGDFITVALNAVSAENYSQTIDASAIGELGIEYKFDVTNGVGLKNDEVLYNARLSFPGNGLTVPYNSPGTDVSNYRIVSVPLAMTADQVSAVFDELGAADNSRWRMFHYEDGTNRELNTSSAIEPGNGYWLIAKENPGVLQSGAGITVDASSASPFQISLSAGWNQIGNPYNFNISWADVQAANPGLPGLRNYDSTFVDATQLNKMEGGFVNVSAARTITIPVQKNTTVNGGRIANSNSLQNPLSEKNWQVYLELRQGKLVNKISGFGMHQEAAEGYDIYDGLSMPRFFGSWLEINHEKKNGGISYAKDMVPSSEDHTWEFTIESSSDEDRMTLNWDNTYFGVDGPELYLWDDAQQLGVNMRTTNRYVFRKSGSKLFKVVYGTADYVKAETTIREFALYDAWPNPATRTDGVTLSLAVPESASAGLLTIRIVDITGRSVWNQEASYTAGRHTFYWKPTEKEIPGIYVVVIQAGQSIEQKRVVLKE